MTVVRWIPAVVIAALLSSPCQAGEADVRERLQSLEFANSDTYSRMSRIRSLSLLTFAETKSSRLFLGVNRDGLFGLHFGVAKRGDDRYPELARMPYLRSTTY